jgi:hypothetical protein
MSVERAPEWVGEGDARRDVASMNDRGVAIAALDAVLRLSVSLKRHSDEFREFLTGYEEEKVSLLRELPDHEKRINALEGKPRGQPNRETGDYRGEMPSSHEWDEMLVKAGALLSQRVKDPRDRLDSNRAKEIAEGVILAAKTADDAKAFRSLKSRSRKIAWAIVKGLVTLALGALAARYGFHWGG